MSSAVNWLTEGTGGKPQVALQRQEAVYGLAAGDGIQVPPPGQRDQAVGEEFQMSGELTFGFAEALGETLDFT